MINKCLIRSFPIYDHNKIRFCFCLPVLRIIKINLFKIVAQFGNKRQETRKQKNTSALQYYTIIKILNYLPITRVNSPSHTRSSPT